jgi:hypothetical protein
VRLLIAAIAATAAAGSASAPVRVDSLLAADMAKPSEARPHGVPAGYDWAAGPRAHDSRMAARFAAFTAWGQLYRCAGAAVPRRAVELRDLQAWALSRATGRWTEIQHTSDLDGASFAEDYRRPTTAARIVRRDATTTIARLRGGYNFHFWPSAGRVAVAGRDTAAVVVALRARLAPTPGLAGRPPCVLLSAGGDFWRSVGASPSTAGAVADAGIGRFKLVQRSWRLFTMTTASPDVLLAHPIPLRARGSELR